MRTLDKLICYKKLYSLIDDGPSSVKLLHRKDLQKTIEIELLSNIVIDDFLKIKIDIVSFDLSDNLFQLLRLFDKWFLDNSITVEKTNNEYLIKSDGLTKIFKMSGNTVLGPLEMSYLSLLVCSDKITKKV